MLNQEEVLKLLEKCPPLLLNGNEILWPRYPNCPFCGGHNIRRFEHEKFKCACGCKDCLKLWYKLNE